MWKYRVLTFSSATDEWMEAALNKLGSEGWELVGVSRHPGGGLTFAFKRQANSA
jgi:hypothetical protein